MSVTPSQSRPKDAIWKLIAVLFLIAGLGGCVALALGGKRSVEAAQPIGSTFLTTIEKADYKAAQSQLSKATQANATPQKIADIMGLLKKQYGKPVSHSQPNSFNVSTYNGVTRVRFGYIEKFEKGERPVQLSIVRENNEWKVESFNFPL